MSLAIRTEGAVESSSRYHGVFAPHSKLRAAVTPAGRGKGKRPAAEEGTDKPATPRHVAMNWAKRLKRVFGIDIEACARCGGTLRVIASIEEPEVIAKILAHLGSSGQGRRARIQVRVGGRADSAGARGATAAGRRFPAAAFAGLGLAAAASGSP